MTAAAMKCASGWALNVQAMEAPGARPLDTENPVVAKLEQVEGRHCPRELRKLAGGRFALLVSDLSLVLQRDSRSEPHFLCITPAAYVLPREDGGTVGRSRTFGGLHPAWTVTATFETEAQAQAIEDQILDAAQLSRAVAQRAADEARGTVMTTLAAETGELEAGGQGAAEDGGISCLCSCWALSLRPKFSAREKVTVNFMPAMVVRVRDGILAIAYNVRKALVTAELPDAETMRSRARLYGNVLALSTGSHPEDLLKHHLQENDFIIFRSDAEAQAFVDFLSGCAGGEAGAALRADAARRLEAAPAELQPKKVGRLYRDVMLQLEDGGRPGKVRVSTLPARLRQAAEDEEDRAQEARQLVAQGVAVVRQAENNEIMDLLS